MGQKRLEPSSPQLQNAATHSIVWNAATEPIPYAGIRQSPIGPQRTQPAPCDGDRQHIRDERQLPGLDAQVETRQCERVRPRRLAAISAVLFLACGPVVVAMERSPAELSGQPGYVGSESCSACHADQVAAWRGSHHGWALRAAQGANVLGDFNDAIFEFGGVRTRFFRRNGQAFVETDGPDGAPTAYEIRYTVGVEPLQQYLVETDGSRLQVLDIAWDTTAKRWFHLYPEAIAKPGDGLHWTGPYKTWQARCAVCHQTNFVKGYDPQSKAYRSRWSELTVGCEACHGPGEAHVVWAKDPDGFYAAGFEAVDQKGLTVAFGKADGRGRDPTLCGLPCTP